MPTTKVAVADDHLLFRKGLIEIIEGDDAFEVMIEASNGEVLYWEIDGHPNGKGYRVIAETVYSKLIEKGLVP